MEIWKPIKGYEGLYEISSFGQIKRLEAEIFGNWGQKKIWKEKILKKSHDKDGYETICLCKDGKRKTYKVHRLVANAFIKNPFNFYQINHKDENKTNNNVGNLEWCDNKYNANFGTRNYRISNKKSKSILQFDLNNNLIKKWNNAKEICNELKFNYWYILSACRGKYKSAYNYIWTYNKGE